MPTVFVEDGYRFFFFANEGTEPPHVHVVKGEARSKWWLEPIGLEWSRATKPTQLKRINEIIDARSRQILEAWNDFFGS